MTSAGAAGPEPPPPPTPPPSVARGAAWMLLFKLLDKGLGLLSTLVLARLLVPADFGLVAMATAVAAFTQLLGAFGFDTALIQRQDARREHYDTAWTFNVVFGLAIAALLLVLAVPASRFYAEPRLVAILGVLAIGAAAGGFENIGTVAFRKEMDFRSEFRYLMLKRLAAFTITMVLALTLRSYWAMVAGIVTGRLVSLWISYRLHPFRPRLSLSARGDLLHFSKWIFISSVIAFFSSRATDFILGKTVGAHGLGIYNIAYEIAVMPSTELIAPLNRAVYPAYAKLSVDMPRLREKFIELFGVICLLGFPVSLGLVAVADPAVRVVLGDKWLEAIPLIRLFALAGLVSALLSNLFLVVLAMGRPQAITLMNAATLVCFVPAAVWASREHGVLGAAWVQFATTALSVPALLWFFTRLTGLRIAQLLRQAWRPGLASGAMALVVLLTDGLLATSAPAVPVLVRLLCLIAAGAVVYPLFAWSLWRLFGDAESAESRVLALLHSQLAKARRRKAS